MLLYHVTFTKNIKSIKKKGIIPQKKPTFTGALGQDIRKGQGGVYAFSNFEDALQWAFRMNWDSGQDIVIIKFESSSPWHQDTHIEADLAKGDWLYSPLFVEPQNIKEILNFEPSKLKANPNGTLTYKGE